MRGEEGGVEELTRRLRFGVEGFAFEGEGSGEVVDEGDRR